MLIRPGIRWLLILVKGVRERKRDFGAYWDEEFRFVMHSIANTCRLIAPHFNPM
jgi:hypothetical protein